MKWVKYINLETLISLSEVSMLFNGVIKYY